ncbi:hypothetical protein Syn7502_02108 [Synechococcus sp. PCC 7502]|uniref:hypothetical protein n=1 Tax=Synechococcus sp. PCC 7502 TaxID=1173263 RepID=UPI00029FF58E|nr:hypothetical protein [Synechococcus sp. PCC 7502]AFY74126.1 hypothetical protein Syn7502_02108 [Synechococcus sp. PCC 7502]
MNSNIQGKFELDGKVVGRISRGSEFPQSPSHPEAIGTLVTSISFEGIVIKNNEKVIFRITEVNDHGNKQIDQMRERGMQVISIGQIFSVDELTGWDIQPA